MKLKNLSATKTHGSTLAKTIKSPALILLSGDLGAGKTEWARAFIRAYLREPEKIIPSPTYSIINSFKKGSKEVVHMDLYRLRGGEDLESIGFWDYMNRSNIICIEWGEFISKELLRSRDVYSIQFKITSETERELTCFFDPSH